MLVWITNKNIEDVNVKLFWSIEKYNLKLIKIIIVLFKFTLYVQYYICMCYAHLSNCPVF